MMFLHANFGINIAASPTVTVIYTVIYFPGMHLSLSVIRQTVPVFVAYYYVFSFALGQWLRCRGHDSGFPIACIFFFLRLYHEQ